MTDKQSWDGVPPGPAGSEPAGRPARRRREPTPAQRALGLLVRREHSQRELERKLVARGVEKDAATSAVARLREAGWQDDVRFACSLARSRATSGYGPLRIRSELATHGLSAETIASAFGALAEAGEDDWKDTAAGLVRRRFGKVAGDVARARKAADFLLRRGFDAETVRAAVRDMPDDWG